MAQKRGAAAACLLPSGRVAVVGGYDQNFHRLDGGEAFDPEARTWQPLPPMAHQHTQHGLVAVAGGLLVLGGDANAGNELFDEASGRWFQLPHPMAEPRAVCCAVSLPASALAAAPAGGAAAAAQ